MMTHDRVFERAPGGGIKFHDAVSYHFENERFVEFLGEPPIRYSARYRMRKAADLLETGATADEAAYAVGFSSAASFTRAFKREYGEPPATWARNVRS